MTERLPGKVAMVTGAAQGIGLEISKKFFNAGAAVFIADINEEEIERAIKQFEKNDANRMLACRVDVCDRENVREGVESCYKAFGRLDYLVNNAGIVGRGTVEQMDLDLWRSILDVNLTGSFLCSQAVIPYMKETGGGVILNVSSISARVPGLGLAAYSSTKAALEVFTKVLAAEVAPYGIRVNAYAPGVTSTPMTQDLINARGAEKLDQIAMRRFGDADDIAELVLFLCSEKSSWITGAIISIDGGTMIVGKPWEAWSK
jgi:3-oxoacyl-[acyl-carrier protein] reductase